MGSHITVSTRAVDGMRLVVARLVVAIVRIDGSAATRTQVTDASGISSQLILAVSILIVAVGEIVLDVLQVSVVSKCLGVIGKSVTGFEIILVEVVSHLAIAEVIIRIAIIPASIKTIDVWSAIGCLILEAAMEVATFGVATCNFTTCQTEVIYLSLVVFDEAATLRDARDHIAVAVYYAHETIRSDIIIRCNDIVLEDKLSVRAIAADRVDKLRECLEVLLVA